MNGELTRLKDRLDRIAEAHSRDVNRHGRTSGFCCECDRSWPCPTNVWATTDRDFLDTWDPKDAL